MKTMKTSVAVRFRVRSVKRGWRVMGGGGGAVQISWWWWGGIAFANMRQKGLGVENHKNERGSLFSGTPYEMGAQDDGGRWWGGADKLVVVVGWCLHRYKVG
jgi:hypothetical protein